MIICFFAEDGWYARRMGYIALFWPYHFWWMGTPHPRGSTRFTVAILFTGMVNSSIQEQYFLYASARWDCIRCMPMLDGIVFVVCLCQMVLYLLYTYARWDCLLSEGVKCSHLRKYLFFRDVPRDISPSQLTVGPSEKLSRPWRVACASHCVPSSGQTCREVQRVARY